VKRRLVALASDLGTSGAESQRGFGVVHEIDVPPERIPHCVGTLCLTAVTHSLDIDLRGARHRRESGGQQQTARRDMYTPVSEDLQMTSCETAHGAHLRSPCMCLQTRLVNTGYAAGPQARPGPQPTRRSGGRPLNVSLLPLPSSPALFLCIRSAPYLLPPRLDVSRLEVLPQGEVPARRGAGSGKPQAEGPPTSERAERPARLGVSWNAVLVANSRVLNPYGLWDSLGKSAARAVGRGR